ncbi:MAG: FtsX-like permease family protein [Verrucomicrobia bacterium]|nr:MAG: FtsX-like permease family protein [Verrucomicrobiota bacterium]
MAWRDSRRSRRRLVLFSLSITLGIAALVALGSMGRTLRGTIDEQSKALLGADLVLTSRQPAGPEEIALAEKIGGERASEVSFASMVSFPDRDAARLVNVRAIAGGFPFYGRIETEPAAAADAFRHGDGVLVEEGMAQQFDLRPGDRVKLGNWTTRMAGMLRRVPGDSVAFATLAPRVYIAASELPRTGLLKRGALVRYRAMFKLPAQPPVARIVRDYQGDFRRLRLDVDTAEKRQQDLGKALEDLNAFLNLVAFVALLLGAVGIASAIQVHVQQRLGQVAILRCLGAPMASTFAIYLAQAIALGCAGSVAGVAVGATVQLALPAVFHGLLPFPIHVDFSVPIAARAVATGIGISVVFVLLPLLAVRRVSPLVAIRAAYEAPRTGPDLARIAVHALVGAAVFGFALLQTRHWYQGAGFAVGLGLAFLLLAAAARLLVWAARRFVPARLPFVWRQGLASLHRPQNRTTTLLVSLGLGTFLLLTLQFTRSTLLHRLFPPGGERRPNAILFDVQPDQLAGVTALLERQGFPILDQAPIVTMRIKSVNDRPVRELATNRSARVPGWILQREYRSTWRTNLTDSEKLVAGRLVPRVGPASARIPITLEQGIARDLGVGVGDRMAFDVQGVAVDCEVSGLREVDWRQVRPNFFVVFPAGALESAPAMHVVATRVGNARESARLQRELVREFPNVAAIDLTLVLETVNNLVSKVGFAIRFMALFTVLTGVVVLVGAIVTGRWQRSRESILLRTLGASRAQVRWILFVEYASLGILAATTGLLLAMAGGWALAHFVFKSGFQIPWIDALVALVAVPALTVAVGLATSRGIANAPPLEILRQEA